MQYPIFFVSVNFKSSKDGADGADIDEDGADVESWPSPRVSEIEEVPVAGLPSHLVPIQLSSGDETLAEATPCADIASGDADQSKRRRLEASAADLPSCCATLSLASLSTLGPAVFLTHRDRFCSELERF